MADTHPDQPTPTWEAFNAGQRWFFLAILFLVSLCNYVDRQVMSVLIEPIKHEFHASDAMMGLLTGFAFAACYAVMGLPVARLSDRGDRRLVITLSVAVWSVMTMACGFAQSFVQLAVMRMGVGVGEAGAIPPAQSLIADYFPPKQRGRALALFMMSATFGYLIAFAGGARLAHDHGWRLALIALGAPGLLLALITLTGLKEPRRQRGGLVAPGASETVLAGLAALARKPSFVLLNVAMVLYFLVAYGAVTWFPAYMGRVMHLSLVEIGGVWGVISAAAALIGTVSGGFITDTLGKRDVRWIVRAPAIVLLLTCPVYEFALSSDNVAYFFISAGLAGTALGAGVPALFAALHMICGSKRRATAVAVTFFFANLLGLGFGPLITGELSDLFTASFGPVGLRYALMAAMTIMAPCGLATWACARTFRADLED